MGIGNIWDRVPDIANVPRKGGLMTQTREGVCPRIGEE